MPSFPAAASDRRPGAALLLVLALLAPAAAAQDSRKAQAAAQRELSELHRKMEALSREQAETAARRDSLNAALTRQAAALAAAAGALRETDAALAERQRQLDALEQQRSELQSRLAARREAIAALLRASYAQARTPELALLLGTDDPMRGARLLTYAAYLQRDHAERVQALMDDLDRMQHLAEAIDAERQALIASRAERERQAQALAAQRAAQQRLAAEADAQYRTQAERLAALKQNEQALDALLAKLQRAIDEAEREAARRAQSAPVPPGKGLANIRGNLPWPAAGPVNRYGNGVLIRAPAGSEVRAVARGRVVYAAFLRGYGMLLIVNHGDGWMSMYGNNETLLHAVGTQVDAGQVVGTAAAPLGENTGVYFELRHNGQPVDPRTWLARLH